MSIITIRRLHRKKRIHKKRLNALRKEWEALHRESKPVLVLQGDWESGLCADWDDLERCEFPETTDEMITGKKTS